MALTDYESAVIDFLAQKENVRFAFEIAERLEQLKDKLQLKFWHTFDKKVKEKLGSIEGWQCVRDTDEKLQQMKECVGLVLDPLGNSPSRYLRPRIEQDEKGLLWYGIGWSKETKDLPRLREIVALRDMLEEMDYDIENTYDGWWLGIKETDWRLRDKIWCLRIADGDALEEEIAASFVDLFKGTETPVEEANLALAKTISDDSPSV